jgi:hypothetical protein
LPTSSRSSFHTKHAAVQALQPMHLVTSISWPTCSTAPFACGGGVVVADLRVMASEWMFMASP